MTRTGIGWKDPDLRQVLTCSDLRLRLQATAGRERIAELKRLRSGITLGGAVAIRQLIDQGRKY